MTESNGNKKKECHKKIKVFSCFLRMLFNAEIFEKVMMKMI